MLSNEPPEHRDDYLARVLAECETRIARNEQELEELRKTMLAQMTMAMEQAIRNAAANPETWKDVRAALSQQSKVVAGGWLFSVFQSVFNRIGLVIFTLSAIYVMGGPSAVFAAVKAWLFSPHT